MLFVDFALVILTGGLWLFCIPIKYLRSIKRKVKEEREKQ